MVHTYPVNFDSLLTQMSSDLALLLIHSLVWYLPIIANSLTLFLREDLYTSSTQAQAAARALNQARLEPPNMAAVTFALTPGRASTATPDYTTTEGIKFYNKATKGMEPPYELSNQKPYPFLSQVSHKANQMNWDTIINVPQSTQPAWNADSCAGPCPCPHLSRIGRQSSA